MVMSGEVEHAVAQLEQLKLATVAAQGRKGQRPTNKSNREALQKLFAELAQFPDNQGAVLRTCFIAFTYAPSTKTLSKLKPMTISDLHLETNHKGKVLFARTFGQPVRLQAVQNAIEDINGDVDRVSLYNDDHNRKPEQLLPEGAILAIKEPFYKATADGGYSIRVDHPSDLIILQPTDPRVPAALAPRLVQLEKPALEWKNDGNAALAKTHLITALNCYSRGIEACDSETCKSDELRQLKTDLQRNRALINLHLQRFEPAEADAKASMLPTSDPNAVCYNTKAHLRAGLAAYKLGDFDGADASFANALQLTPDHIDALKERERTMIRLHEQKTGEYDFSAISDSARKGSRNLDHASFSANIEIRSARRHGRGIFAVKAIKAGDLILCEKAFATASLADKEKDLYTVVDVSTKRATAGSQAKLLFDVVQKLRHHPGQARRFLTLYDGGYKPKCTAPVVDGVTVVDVFQTQAIICYNNFALSDPRSPIKLRSRKVMDVRGGVGIWIIASHFNHACDGSATRTFFGDMMVVRATRDIAKDEEIRLPYILVTPDSRQTAEALQAAWRFKCDCRICVAEGRTPANQRIQRRKLVEEAYAFLDAHQNMYHLRCKGVVARGEELYREIAASYDTVIFDGVPKLGLLRLGMSLCGVYSTEAKHHKMYETAVQALRNMGFVVSVERKSVKIDRTHAFFTEAVADVAMFAALAAVLMGRRAVALRFQEFAKQVFVLLTGELRGFDARYDVQVR